MTKSNAYKIIHIAIYIVTRDK